MKVNPDATTVTGSAADRAAALTQQLRTFGSDRVLSPRILALSEIVAGMQGVLRRLVPGNIEITTDLDAALHPVRADSGQLEQVLLNLVINAADAMPLGGRIAIRTTNVAVDIGFSDGHIDIEPGSYVCLTVSDTGHGMDKETASRIFEPFFTTKPVGKGTGLGLPTVLGIVTQAGGKVWVYSEPGLGATFKVHLPRGEGVVSPVARRAPEPSRPATETILLVEDEASTRDAIERTMARAGYRVILADNGADALKTAELTTSDIDMVLTDSMMPGMGGLEMINHLRRARPRLKVLMMSGYTDPVTRFGISDLPFIEKPFSSADLLSAIQRVLHGGKSDPAA